jgi:hypothetical protein
MLKPDIGDIVEIETGAGLAYIHVTHEHPSYPPVLRALPGLHAARPHDPAALAARPGGFVAMMPLGAALARLGLAARVVAHAPPEGAARAFPTFRMPVRDRAGEVVYWWFWDGETLRHASELTEEEARLPMREVMGAETFLDLIPRQPRA